MFSAQFPVVNGGKLSKVCKAAMIDSQNWGGRIGDHVQGLPLGRRPAARDDAVTREHFTDVHHNPETLLTLAGRRRPFRRLRPHGEAITQEP